MTQNYTPKQMTCRTFAYPTSALYNENQNCDPTADDRGALYVVALPPGGSTGLGPLAFAAYVDVTATIGAANLLTANGFNDHASDTVYIIFADGPTAGNPALESFKVSPGSAFSWTPSYPVGFGNLAVVASSTPDVITPLLPGHKFWLRVEYLT